MVLCVHEFPAQELVDERVGRDALRGSHLLDDVIDNASILDVHFTLDIFHLVPRVGSRGSWLTDKTCLQLGWSGCRTRIHTDTLIFLSVKSVCIRVLEDLSVNQAEVLCEKRGILYCCGLEILLDKTANDGTIERVRKGTRG